MCVIDRSPVIETRRLSLRAPRMEDAPRIAELCNDYAIPSMTSRMPWPYAAGDAEDFVRCVQAQDRQVDNTFVLELEDEGVVGAAGLFTPPGERLELGYWIGRAFWGRGLATEAAVGLVDWAKYEWRKRVVVAGHFADNPASGQVLCKTGFLYTGEVQMRPSKARGGDTACRMMVWLA